MIENQKRVYTELEAAQYIGVSQSFLSKGRMNDVLKGTTPPPRYIKMGSRSIRYLKEDLDDWVEQFEKVIPNSIQQWLDEREVQRIA